MPGYVLMHSECANCHQLMSYNPKLVPSVRVNGQREPICLDCIHRINPKRVAQGFPPIIPHRDAYEPLPEEELGYD